jgi:site-specific recombinase XerD
MNPPKTEFRGAVLMEIFKVGEFADYLALQRGLSASTIRAYRYDLTYYGQWLESSGKRLADVVPKDLDGYVRYMAGTLGLQAKTCKRRIAAISTYHKWLVREGIVKNDPVYFVELPKAGARLPVYLADDEIRRFAELMEAEAAKRPIIGARNRALMYLMIFGGLRISEALSITERKITFRDGYPVMISIVGKGDKERQVPLAEDVARALLAWMETKKALRDNDDLARRCTRKNRAELTSEYLFPGRNGRPLNKFTVQQKVKSMRDAFGGKKLTPHKLRHTFATSLFRAGVDIKTTQELLGHASIATTQIYTHVEDAQKLDAVRRLRSVLPVRG